MKESEAATAGSPGCGVRTGASAPGPLPGPLRDVLPLPALPVTTGVRQGLSRGVRQRLSRARFVDQETTAAIAALNWLAGRESGPDVPCSAAQMECIDSLRRRVRDQFCEEPKVSADELFIVVVIIVFMASKTFHRFRPCHSLHHPEGGSASGQT